MDKWFQDNLHPEFDLQQDIATKNQDKNDNYLILDMEYGFTQDGITIDDRQRTAFFDLLGIERKTNKVVFFEVKKGLNALTCSAGIGSHINSFETFLNGENKTVYRKDLERDIVNIVSDKTVLGIINNYSLPANFSLNNMDIELIFVFEADKYGDNSMYEQIFAAEHKQSKGANKEYKTIFVTPNNRKLI